MFNSYLDQTTSTMIKSPNLEFMLDINLDLFVDFFLCFFYEYALNYFQDYSESILQKPFLYLHGIFYSVEM